MSKNCISIKGARMHNLKNISVEIPRNKYVVITGISGSGKSTLAFDTIFAEGQRRYVESLSAYARQFLGQMKKPDVDSIEGMSPAISIDQKTRSKNPRSTVGTTTEIYDYLRLLFARIGIPHCPSCGRVIEKQSVSQIVEQIMKLKQGTKILLLAPVINDRKGEHQGVFSELLKQGFTRARVNGTIYDLASPPTLKRYEKHTIEAIVDRLVIKSQVKRRLADSIEIAIGLAGGLIRVLAMERKEDQELQFSTSFGCPDCGVSLEELTPRMFSFNSPHGACPQCHGLGTIRKVDPKLVVPDHSLTINQGCVLPWAGTSSTYLFQILKAVGRRFKFSLNTPFKKLKKEQQDVVLFGSGDVSIRVRLEGSRMSHEFDRPWEGIVPNLERRYKETKSEWSRREIEKYIRELNCTHCGGTRLRPESRAVTIAGKHIHEISRMSVSEANNFFKELKLPRRETLIASEVLKEIRARLNFLNNVGLSYLNLDRTSPTLSGGESQRIRLATQIGSGLVGVVYILDEPSIGLHQRDNRRLIKTLKNLRDLGNTLIVVEHDEETIRSADHVIDLGPGAGVHGGELVAIGSPKAITRNRKSLTGRYLAGLESIPVPKSRRSYNGKEIVVRGARENNLRNIDVRIPMGVFNCITGVSGSGKSTLINEILYRQLAHHFYGSLDVPGDHDRISGLKNVDKVIIIDQSPIGRTPRSNPATYVGLFTPIRDVFAKTKEARIRGYKPGRFSFNVKGGRCEICEGGGIVKIEMHFLPDIYIPCETCKGKRFNRETLEVKYKDKNIAEVLEMTVEEALKFFENIPTIRNKLKTLHEVGLGYIRVGQPATTLSGGEAQRVKLSKELSKRGTGKTLYLLDEPTTGLHFADISRLLDVLARLTDNGNTIVVIEHNLDVIKCADHIIDLGPDGGDEGGLVVAQGTPEEIVKSDTHTGRYLKKVLKRS